MAEPFTEAQRRAIVVAAAAAAGPVGDDETAWVVRVAEAGARIAAFMDERHPVSRSIDGVGRAKTFRGTIVSVSYERSSTRGIVGLRTAPSEHHPDGVEQARTERTDSSIGLAMARRAKALIGHRVQVWVEVEQVSGSKNVRVLRHVEDLGLDDAATAAA